MATIELYSSGGVDGHLHVEEDLTSQIDGYGFIFTTSQEYIPGSLIVIYAGVSYTKDNDFSELPPNQFSLVNGPPFPPKLNFPLVVTYRRKIV